MRLLPCLLGAVCFLVVLGGVVTAQTEDAPVVREIASKDLQVFAAAFEANLITGQLAGGRRVVVVRRREETRFPAVEWLGLRERDAIERVNGAAPRNAGAVVDAVRGLGGGGELTLSVLRDGVRRSHILRVGGTPVTLPKPAHKQRDDVMVLQEDILEAEWAEVEPWTLLVAAAPVMARDASGKVIGVTSAGFSDIPFAAMLGLQSGDIIQSVNGHPVDSEQAIFRLINKLEGERSFTAVVLRDGKPLTLRYRVE